MTSPLSKYNPFRKLASKSGTSDVERATWHTKPWAWRDDSGIYVGHNKEVWMYREMTVAPMQWEDPGRRLEVGSPLATCLYELGQTSKDMGVGMKSLSRSREVHILSISWETNPTIPDGTPAELREFVDAIVTFTVPRKALLIGVKLWSSIAASPKGVMAHLKTQATGILGEEVPELDKYANDRKVVDEILRRNGAAKAPGRDVRDQMESWFNLGRGVDVEVFETKDLLYVDDFDRIEMAAVSKFDTTVMYAPDAPWGISAQTHQSPASVISVRGEIEPTSVSRSRLRRSQRRVLAQIEEEAATGDLERPEQAATFALAQDVERFVLSGREPLVTNTSIIMARRVGPDAAESYKDELAQVYDIEVTPLVHRQMDALDECLPTSGKRTNPFLQDVSVAMLAHAGLQAFSNLGDQVGIYTGLVDPDYSILWTNPLGAPARNLPAATLVAGDSGSGKTFLLQFTALQTALAGLQTIFINPKDSDDLSGLADLVDGRVVNIAEVESGAGYFDPCRFTPDTPQGRAIAADIAAQHILSVLGSRGVAGQGFTQEQEIAVLSGLRTGFERGARCVWDALQHVPDKDAVELIRQQASDPLFRLGIGFTPAEPYHEDRGLLLIQFNRRLDLPEKGVPPAQYLRQQRVALAAVKLVTRAAMELLSFARGGVMIVDEAWMFLQSSDGLAALQSLGRLGRSQNIWPIFATQRVDDLIRDGVDMEAHISRVTVMKLSEDREAAAALKLCGLSRTADRIAWLKQAGPRQQENGQPARGAMALHRDLNGRHSAILIGPVPESVRQALSTNPEDRARRRAERGE